MGSVALLHSGPSAIREGLTSKREEHELLTRLLTQG